MINFKRKIEIRDTKFMIVQIFYIILKYKNAHFIFQLFMNGKDFLKK